ncbi:cell division cycle protein 20-like [Scleropages formosus]|uniref:Cell division cycle protein 20-like n=1 Tax=Scleropages formosus TaxID=113540 RepID=A0A0P7UPG4_SCLFO|nr:cell division cycle protein 20 homolog [Scleropages formosus]XP_018590254.1 cell division cycle protein 20 homolog [Scleropages formosus]KPP71414.1 cell division cycle protein 20-like [Scleropages formosus]
MTHFGFESEVQNLLKLDMPVSSALTARYHRKGSSSSAATLGVLSPGKTGNRSLSLSKTPSKTPGKNGKGRCTPSKPGGDRFIPCRNGKQMEVASFLLSKENDPVDPNISSEQKAWAMNLNGFDIDEAKILHLGGKPQNVSEGYHNSLKVLYSHVPTPASTKKTRYISSVPDRILDAPDLRNDFYLNLLDWSSQNLLAVALHNNVYLWNATHGDIIFLMKLEQEEDYICSISWSKDGNFIAIGTSDNKVQLWDVENQKRLRCMASHTSRVGALSWNNHVLSSGSRSGHIHHHDVRVADHHIFTLTGHSQEVCGLKWSPDGKYLASGGNDNLAYVWPGVQEGGNQAAINCFNHQGAVKALAWCPWQANILATGGGTSDRHIRIWNASTGSCISSLDTESQISSLVFAPNYKELVSGHGYTHDSLIIWKYPSMTKVAELSGHGGRVLNLTMSPDCSTIASVAADETVRLWKCFELDPVKKKAKERMAKSTSIIHQGIR